MSAFVRPARTGDVDAIFHVRTSVTQNRLSLDQLIGFGITPSAIAAMIRETACAWVAEDGGQVVGFSMAGLAKGSLFAAFVLPSHEGRGLGRLLVQAAEDALFARHAVIWLETGRATRAAGFYRHLGWSHQADIGETDIRLQKSRP